MKKISFIINIHTLPDDLKVAIEDPTSDLYKTAVVYNMLVESNLLWKVWAIDEYNQLWVEVNFINKCGKPEFHTLKIDDDTYEKIECDEYSVLTDV